MVVWERRAVLLKVDPRKRDFHNKALYKREWVREREKKP